jgi:hypothetical protein
MRTLCLLIFVLCACSSKPGFYQACQWIDPHESSDNPCSGGSCTYAPGVTGAFCTAICMLDADCPAFSGYTQTCLSEVCFLACPDAGTCPYGQGCFMATDRQTGREASLCLP